MVLLTLSILPSTMIDIDDYAKLIKKVLALDISFNIIQFSTTSKSVSLIIDVPKNKVNPLIKELKEYNIFIERKKPISIEEDLCLHCGQCISLCATGALFFNEELKVVYNHEKCVGCLLCVDACVRSAIKEHI